MQSPAHITLVELQRLVKKRLHEQFPLPLWVSAEIAELKVNYSGHCYLELVEKGGDNGVPLAQSRAVIWRSAYPRVAAYFEAETGRKLAPGIRILVRATVTYHELYGFSLQITDIDPTYTLGDMERQRQQTIARLQREGVWEMNRETALPPVVQRIAVVSSAHAAGYQDFCKELAKSPYAFRTELFDAFMQGDAAEESIIAALCAVAERIGEFDAVVLIRGGGSASDLNCFNAYRLCAYIAQFPLPVLTGIGHDKDTSVADMVAHTALKTPTAVAGWLVDRSAEVDAWLDRAAGQLHDTTVEAMRRAELQLERLAGELRRRSDELTARRRLQLERLAGELSQRSATLVARQRMLLDAAAQQLPRAVGELLARQRNRLEAAGELVEARSPRRFPRLGCPAARTGGRPSAWVRGTGGGTPLKTGVPAGGPRPAAAPPPGEGRAPAPKRGDKGSRPGGPNPDATK